MFWPSKCFIIKLNLFFLLKNLLLEYDKQSEQLDVEKERANNFEHHIEDLTKQLRNSTCQVISNQINLDKQIIVNIF